MTEIETPLLIEQGRDIRECFLTLDRVIEDETRELDEDISSSLANTNDRFFLWASNVGLFNPAHSSLDYQLRDNKQVRIFINDLLLAFEKLLQNVTKIITGVRIPFEALDGDQDVGSENIIKEGGASDTDVKDVADDVGHISSTDSSSFGSLVFGGVDEDNHQSETGLLVEQMSSVVDQLFSVALQIRNPITRKIPNVDRIDLYSHIDVSFKESYIKMREEMEYQGLLQVFRQCRKENEKLEKNDNNSGDTIHDDDRDLIHRLLKANRTRRCRFHYWKRYKIKSSRFATASDKTDHCQTLAPTMPRTTMNRPLVASSIRPSEVSHQVSSRLTSAKPLPASFILDENIAPSSKSSRAPTSLETGPDGLVVHWPTPPGGFYSSGKSKNFECPYCFFFCPPRTTKVEAWKNHLRFDLLPYQCTYPQCREADTLFDSFDNWNLHEQRVHLRIWVCHLDSAEFSERTDYEKHVRAVHSDKASILLTPELISFHESASKACDRPCPICLKGFQRQIDLQKHLARHLESIALLSLPPEEQEDDQNSQQRSSDQSRVAEIRPFMVARSIANDFPEDYDKPLRFAENEDKNHNTVPEKKMRVLSSKNLMLVDEAELSKKFPLTKTSSIIADWNADLTTTYELPMSDKDRQNLPMVQELWLRQNNEGRHSGAGDREHDIESRLTGSLEAKDDSSVQNLDDFDNASNASSHISRGRTYIRDPPLAPFSRSSFKTKDSSFTIWAMPDSRMKIAEAIEAVFTPLSDNLITTDMARFHLRLELRYLPEGSQARYMDREILSLGTVWLEWATSLADLTSNVVKRNMFHVVDQLPGYHVVFGQFDFGSNPTDEKESVSSNSEPGFTARFAATVIYGDVLFTTMLDLDAPGENFYELLKLEVFRQTTEEIDRDSDIVQFTLIKGAFDLGCSVSLTEGKVIEDWEIAAKWLKEIRWEGHSTVYAHLGPDNDN